MNQEHSFETIPFEIAPEFQGEMFEDESEWGWGVDMASRRLDNR